MPTVNLTLPYLTLPSLPSPQYQLFPPPNSEIIQHDKLGLADTPCSLHASQLPCLEGHTTPATIRTFCMRHLLDLLPHGDRWTCHL